MTTRPDTSGWSNSVFAAYMRGRRGEPLAATATAFNERSRREQCLRAFEKQVTERHLRADMSIPLALRAAADSLSSDELTALGIQALGNSRYLAHVELRLLVAGQQVVLLPQDRIGD